jgi:hypothetical protein
MSIEHKYFNCTQDDGYSEVENRASYYKKPDEVKAFLKKKCEDGTIKNSTHVEVKALLAAAGYELVKNK